MKLWWNDFTYRAASSECVSTDSRISLCICPHLPSEKNPPTLLFHLLVLFDFSLKWMRFQDCFDSLPPLSFPFQMISNTSQRVLSEFIIPNREQNSPDSTCDLRVIIKIIGSHFIIIIYLNVSQFCFHLTEFLPVTIIILNFYFTFLTLSLQKKWDMIQKNLFYFLLWIQFSGLCSAICYCLPLYLHLYFLSI